MVPSCDGILKKFPKAGWCFVHIHTVKKNLKGKAIKLQCRSFGESTGDFCFFHSSCQMIYYSVILEGKFKR